MQDSSANCKCIFFFLNYLNGSRKTNHGVTPTYIDSLPNLYYKDFCYFGNIFLFYVETIYANMTNIVGYNTSTNDLTLKI